MLSNTLIKIRKKNRDSLVTIELFCILNEKLDCFKMFSLIYLSFVLFTMESETTYLSDSLANTCFNFYHPEDSIDNDCEERNLTIRKNQISFDSACVKCNINSIRDPIKPNCSKDFDCVLLVFENNTLFEDFFAEHRFKLQHLFKTQDGSVTAILTIFVEFYNITIITRQYIESYLNVNATYMRIYIRFQHHPEDSPQLTVSNEMYSINIKLITIQIDCDHNTSSIYTIMGANETSRILHTICSVLQPIDYVSFLK
jgi:hypothetical protein